MNKNSFLRGVASALDLFPSEKERTIHVSIQSDDEAIKQDLEQVGNDMFFAIKSISQEEK
jgi:hypothetical protein